MTVAALLVPGFAEHRPRGASGKVRNSRQCRAAALGVSMEFPMYCLGFLSASSFPTSLKFPESAVSDWIAIGPGRVLHLSTSLGIFFFDHSGKFKPLLPCFGGAWCRKRPEENDEHLSNAGVHSQSFGCFTFRSARSTADAEERVRSYHEVAFKMLLALILLAKLSEMMIQVGKLVSNVSRRVYSQFSP